MISVVVPLYNKKSSIKSTMESVLAQSYSDFELIVVDDGSTDGSADVVKCFDDKRIRLISKKNGGVSSARNEGIKNAQSEYVSFLDADDIWDENYLENVNQLIHDFPNAGIWGVNYGFETADGMHIKLNDLPMDFRGYLSNPWHRGQVYWTSSSSSSKTALNAIGGFDERLVYGEDLDVWFRLILEYGGAFYNKCLAYYRQNAENRLMKQNIALDKLYIFYFEKYKKYREENSDFRHFIDQECLWWLFPYYAENPSDENVLRILKQIDLNEYKLSFRFRFKFPELYKILKGLN